jgi:hypothetical protein
MLNMDFKSLSDQKLQEQPPSSSNDLIQKIDLSYIMVSERRGN